MVAHEKHSLLSLSLLPHHIGSVPVTPELPRQGVSTYEKRHPGLTPPTLRCGRRIGLAADDSDFWNSIARKVFWKISRKATGRGLVFSEIVTL